MKKNELMDRANEINMNKNLMDNLDYNKERLANINKISHAKYSSNISCYSFCDTRSRKKIPDSQTSCFVIVTTQIKASHDRTNLGWNHTFPIY